MDESETQDAEYFRIFFWQKFVPILALPVFAFLLAIAPVTNSWTIVTWCVVGGIVACGIAVYLAKAWQRSSVVLDDDGLTVYGTGGWQTWPYEKLLKVKQFGKYRVKMCYDPDLPDQHMHITLDLFEVDTFVDALLDRYAIAAGEELPLPEAA